MLIGRRSDTDSQKFVLEGLPALCFDERVNADLFRQGEPGESPDARTTDRSTTLGRSITNDDFSTEPFPFSS